MYKELKEILKKAAIACFVVLSWFLRGGAEVNNEKSESG
jgi:hypothetical protein